MRGYYDIMRGSDKRRQESLASVSTKRSGAPQAIARALDFSPKSHCSRRSQASSQANGRRLAAIAGIQIIGKFVFAGGGGRA